ncbi:MAG: zf-HC2 domain-containing protein [Pseudomonadota bacterium]
MTWMLNCRQATQLVLQGEDRALRWPERLRLRLHLAVCEACPRFVGQVQLMRRAMGGWRAYRDGADEPPG